MGNRKDALLAASAFMSAINEQARKHNDILATVGSLHIYPNVVNAIPSRASLTLEVRSINDNAREAFASYAREIANEVADKYSTDFSFSQTYNQAAVLCDPALISRLKKSTNYTTGKAITLPSGATHDASAMADLCPMSMLFVRCENGTSHTPEEFASSADMHVAVGTIAEFLRSLPT
jgi:allantoate deiminase